jgi:hypothetical protein
MEYKKLVGALILFALIFTVGLLIPFSVVLGKVGLKDPDIVNQLDFYVNLIEGFGIAMIVLYLINFFWKRNNQFGDSIGFFNIGEKPSLSFFKRFTAVQLTLLSFIFFSSIFLLANSLKILGKGFTSLVVLPQQFTPLNSLSVSTALIPVGENLLAGFTLGILLLALTIFSIKYKLKESDYKTIAYLIAFFGIGIFGAIWHQSVYGSSDIKIYVVFLFWGIGGLINLATGLWTVFWVMHLTNNFFIDFSRLYSSDTLLFVAIGIILGLSVLYYFLYQNRLFGTNKKQETIV